MGNEPPHFPPDQKAIHPGTEPSRKGWSFRPFWIWLFILFAFVFGLLVFHAPLLRSVSSQLVHDDPLPKGEYAVLLFGSPQWSEGYDQVRRILPKGSQILLVRGKPTRLIRLGLERPIWEIDVEQLKKNKINSFDFLDNPEANPHRFHFFVPLIAKWLDSHPEKSLSICHSRFHGRTMARILARHLNSQQLQRVALIPVNEPDFDPQQWWRKKEGQGAFISGYSNLIFDIFFGDGETPGPDWDPKAYEEALP